VVCHFDGDNMEVDILTGVNLAFDVAPVVQGTNPGIEAREFPGNFFPSAF
jgi:hypothetical protein